MQEECSFLHKSVSSQSFATGNEVVLFTYIGYF